MFNFIFCCFNASMKIVIFCNRKKIWQGTVALTVVALFQLPLNK